MLKSTKCSSYFLISSFSCLLFSCPISLVLLPPFFPNNRTWNLSGFNPATFCRPLAFSAIWFQRFPKKSLQTFNFIVTKTQLHTCTRAQIVLRISKWFIIFLYLFYTFMRSLHLATSHRTTHHTPHAPHIRRVGHFSIPKKKIKRTN